MLSMTEQEKMERLDQLLSHVWMVRTFLKHSEEAAEDEELCDVFRQLYDYMLALGGPSNEGDVATYMKVAKKKLRRLKSAAELFLEIQPEISSHTNFKMAATSLRAAVDEIETIIKGNEPTA